MASNRFRGVGDLPPFTKEELRLVGKPPRKYEYKRQSAKEERIGFIASQYRAKDGVRLGRQSMDRFQKLPADDRQEQLDEAMADLRRYIPKRAAFIKRMEERRSEEIEEEHDDELIDDWYSGMERIGEEVQQEMRDMMFGPTTSSGSVQRVRPRQESPARVPPRKTVRITTPYPEAPEKRQPKKLVRIETPPATFSNETTPEKCARVETPPPETPKKGLPKKLAPIETSPVESQKEGRAKKLVLIETPPAKASKVGRPKKLVRVETPPAKAPKVGRPKKLVRVETPPQETNSQRLRPRKPKPEKIGEVYRCTSSRRSAVMAMESLKKTKKYWKD